MRCKCTNSLCPFALSDSHTKVDSIMAAALGVWVVWNSCMICFKQKLFMQQWISKMAKQTQIVSQNSRRRTRRFTNVYESLFNVCIVGTLGCVFIDNETHESGVTKCTSGEAWSALIDTTRVCFIVNEHTTKCSCFYHTCLFKMQKLYSFMWWNMSGFIWKLGINFAVCIKWIDETWWNNRLLLVPNCYEVVTMVATMVAMVVPLWCHTLR